MIRFFDYLLLRDSRAPLSAKPILGPIAIAAAMLCLAVSALHAAPPKADKEPPVEPSVGYDARLVIHRGETKQVTLRAIPSDGYDVQFKILTQPRFGAISEIVRNSKGVVTILYTHRGEKGQSADSFKFKIKTGPKKCWTTKTARIQITEPPPRMDISPEVLDFDPVFIGESATLPVVVRNSGGSVLQGRVTTADPWSIAGSPEFELASGKSKTFAVTFAPKTPDSQTGKISFETAAAPPASTLIHGIGEHRFEAPDKAAFAQSNEPSLLRIKVSNKTAEHLPLSIQAPLPLEACDRIVLPPNGVSEIELKIQPGFFTDKFASLLLSDGAGERAVKIQLPMPPPVLSWEAPTLDLGDVTAGSTESLNITLNNIGDTPAHVILAAEGDGISIPETSFHIEPRKSPKISASWTFPSPGPASVKVRVTSGAALTPLTFRANVQEVQTPRTSPKTTYIPTPPSSTAYPKSSNPEGFRSLTKEETEEIKKRTPSKISYRFEQRFLRAKALFTWRYGDPQPAKFTIEFETLERDNPLAKPFEDRLKVPDELPVNKDLTQWRTVSEAIANIHQLPDGSWQGSVPNLKPGYHRIRIGAKSSIGNQINYSAFTINAPTSPAFWMNRWFLGSVFLTCAGYLIRRPLLRLFGIAR